MKATMEESNSQSVWTYPWPVMNKNKNISIRKSQSTNKKLTKEVKHSNYDNVPWFSWEEWKNVKDSIFGNSAEDWKSAYHQILVWKARVPKLAVGIESTIPVLHAQIAQADSSMETSFKNSIINMAVLRFVSIVTKGLERHYCVGTPMHGLAASMSLPQYLVDLRNEIIHSDRVFVMSQTMNSAIETCLLWIKMHYWEVEENRMQNITELNSSNGKEMNGCVEEENTLVEEESNSMEDENEVEIAIDKKEKKYQLFYCSLRDLIASILPKNSEILREEIIVKKHVKVASNLRKYFRQNPEKSIEILVREIFFSSTLQLRCNMQEPSKDSRKCDCQCPIPQTIIQRFTPILVIVNSIQAINMFMKTMVAIGTENPEMCCHWFKVMKNTFATEGKVCHIHSFKIQLLKHMHKKIKWKRVVLQLFSINEEWSRDLALELSDLKQKNANSAPKDLLKEVSAIYMNLPQEKKSQNDDSVNNGKKKRRRHKKDYVNGGGNVRQPSELIGKILTLEDLMKEANKASPVTLNYVQELCTQVQPNKKRKIENCIKGKPLGLLPNQQMDAYFYQQLILSSGNPV